jgi:putative transposase
MKISRSSYYDWLIRPATIISNNELKLYRRTKQLFAASRNSLGSRELVKNLRKEGFEVGRYKVIKIMEKLKLTVTQRVAYKVTTKRNKKHGVADNLVKMDFNPKAPNQVWAGDITYLKTSQGWMYLSVVMDLYSRRIIGWAMDKRMTTSLIMKSIQQAYWLRKPPKGVIFHSDRGSQYTSKRFDKLLKKLKITPSMGDVGACWDNAVVERFFGSLKHDWLFKVHHPTRESMILDVTAYMRYYNLKRLHTANGDMSPVEYELCKDSVSGFA